MGGRVSVNSVLELYHGLQNKKNFIIKTLSKKKKKN